MGNHGTHLTAGTPSANAVEGSHILNGTITGADIAGTTIANANIANGTITAAKISSGTITGNKIASNTIAAANICSSTISGDEIASNTIDYDKICSPLGGALCGCLFGSINLGCGQCSSEYGELYWDGSNLIIYTSGGNCCFCICS